MPDTPIVERTPEGKLGYYQGFKAGYEWALTGIRRGLSPDEIQSACEATATAMRNALPED